MSRHGPNSTCPRTRQGKARRGMATAPQVCPLSLSETLTLTGGEMWWRMDRCILIDTQLRYTNGYDREEMDRTRSVHDLNRSMATALVWSGGVDRGGSVVLCACIRMVCVCGDVFLGKCDDSDSGEGGLCTCMWCWYTYVDRTQWYSCTIGDHLRVWCCDSHPCTSSHYFTSTSCYIVFNVSCV